MSEIAKSWSKLRKGWALLDEDDKQKFITHEIGYVLMFGSIIWEFGLPGAVFVLGVVLWYAGKP